ncbi:hypothetical protein RJ55_08681 [Drechmeria coniospora]|nr:hypothetical protein RJ55_08681 [Drechmeria coniospora]
MQSSRCKARFESDAFPESETWRWPSLFPKPLVSGKCSDISIPHLYEAAAITRRDIYNFAHHLIQSFRHLRNLLFCG